MSLTAACDWTFLRALLIAIVAVPVAHRVLAPLRRLSGRFRVFAWGALLAPFLCPELLIGFGYGNFALSLIHHPGWNEALYAAIVFLRLVPVAVIALAFSPAPPVSRAALHCTRLALFRGEPRLRRWRAMAGFWARGPLQAALPAGVLVWLLAFQEFEIASLMGTTAWTVWLFDAHAGGLLLRESLLHAREPAFGQLAVLVTLLITLRITSTKFHGSESPPFSEGTRRGEVRLWAYLAVAAAVTVIIPFALAGRGALAGFASIARNQTQLVGVLREIVTGGLFGLAGGTLAMLAASILPTGVGIVLSLPGLMGSLVVSLATLVLFQQSALTRLYDTPVPLVVAMFLVLLPRALLLQTLVKGIQGETPAVLADMLAQSPAGDQRRSGRDLLWQLRFRGLFWATFLVCYWGYFDLTSAAILAPAGMVTAPVRLYNLMHYGRSAALSAMTLAAAAAPLLALLIAAALRRPVLRLVLR